MCFERKENDARNEAGRLGADTLLEMDADLEVFEATGSPQ
jgi:hypothetical protein